MALRVWTIPGEQRRGSLRERWRGGPLRILPADRRRRVARLV